MRSHSLLASVSAAASKSDDNMASFKTSRESSIEGTFKFSNGSMGCWYDLG